ncbi:MAG: DUF4476 domain-containing protein [Bacteroidetes bacterium]|nr:MAG: DUF4476 domain-containing protein [Bacteroidota bacterium]
MFGRRFALPLAMLLLVCKVYGQTLQIKAPFDVSVSVNGFVSPEAQREFSFQIVDTNRVKLIIRSGDSLFLNRMIVFQGKNQRRYVIEKNAINQWKLFYRSNERITAATSNFTVWERDTTEMVIVKSTPATLEQHLPDSVVNHLTVNDSLRPSIKIEPPIREFEIVKSRFAEIAFEFERTRKIIEWGEEAHPTSGQIGELLELTSYDPSKLMILKSLYEYCSDPENYMQLRDHLQHESNKVQFDALINTWNELE